MSDRDYIAWSLLAAGAFALLLAALGRFGAKPMRSPWERRRDRLELQLGEQLGLHHTSEAGKLEDTIARLDAFASRHPRLGRALLVLDRAHLTAGVLGAGFVGVGLWTDRIGADKGKVSAFVFIVPLLLVGALIAPTEAVIAVSGLYDTHKDLLTFQLLFAQASKKPVLLMKPFGAKQATPKAILDWQTAAHDTKRLLPRRRKERSCHRLSLVAQ